MIQNLKKILNNNRVIFFKNNKIILGDNSKTNAKHKILKKYSKIKKPFELTRIEITFHRGTKFYQGGEVMINIKQYKFNDKKLSLIPSYGNSGSIWIDKKYLVKKKITKKSQIIKLLEKVVKNVNSKKNIKIPGINMITKFDK